MGTRHLTHQVEMLKQRLANRTTQLILALDQIGQMKAALDAAGLEFHETEIWEAGG